MPSRRHFLRTAATMAILPTLTLADPKKAPEVLWKLDLDSASYGGGAIGDLAGNGDKVIVFGTYFNDEHLYAVRTKDGKLLWKFKSEGGPFDASVALVDLDGDGKLEVLAADSSTGALFCLDHAGKVVWKTKLPNSTDSPPSVGDVDGDGKVEIVVGVMSLGDKHGRVVAIDPATRKEKWNVKIPGHVQSEPVLVRLGEGKGLDVIVTTWRGDKCVHALSGKDGSELWQFQLAGDMYHGVSAFDHKGVRLVVTSIAGDVAMLDTKGKAEWTAKPGGYLFAPTAVTDLDGDGVPEIIVVGGRIHVFGVDGKEKWKTDDYGSIARGVAIADADGDGKPDLLFGASDRRFRAIDGRTSKELWSFDATVKGHVYEMIDSGPVVADFAGDGTLSVFFVCGKGTSDKTRKENFGRAYALKIGPGKGEWPMFRGNLRRTGSL
ncbi:MAG TPA: PQQ-binding-like beta-propeller repeat protein [Gemmataceae bacterium]|jgi:outer membrane protein assembly factor BamB|nr:PQQ-binding-like beta-propeller repeat protein [Gemmataceae bacterium]